MNLTFANKNPFSIFDFLGYFFPGALFVSMFYILTVGDMNSYIEKLPAYSSFKSIVDVYTGIGIFIFVLFSYVIGHMIAYISSITVELFYTWYYGYPTNYLLKKENKAESHDKKGGENKQCLLNSKLGFCGMLGHLIICLLLFPILVGHLIIERLFNLKLFIGRSLDAKLIDSISVKVKRVGESIGYNDASTLDADMHRVVMHYVYENCQMHQVKFDNYVALYGFLRSVSFIFCMSFQFTLFYVLFNSKIFDSVCCCTLLYGFPICIIIIVSLCFGASLHKECRATMLRCAEKVLFISVCFIIVVTFAGIKSKCINEIHIVLLLNLFIATYITYLGFAKFYRRFTLENYMALLICKETNSKKMFAEMIHKFYTKLRK